MNETIILSVVIPTKERYEYLKILTKSLIKSTSNKYEIIITDNTKLNSEIVEFLGNLNSNKIKYYHYPEWMSVSENFDKGVSKAQGKYVIALGDDDGVLIDESIEFLEDCLVRNIEAIYPIPIFYQWPDNSHSVWKSTEGTFCKNNKPFYDKKINVELELEKQLNVGFSYGLGKLPRVYQGFVLNKCLKKLYSNIGTAFPGPSPDMANSVALSTFVKNVEYTNRNLCISGHSVRSAGGLGGMKKHFGDIEKMSHLPKNSAELWSDKIPFYWSGPTIYTESARLALLKTNSLLIDKINYNYLYAVCFVFNKYFKNKTSVTVINNNNNSIIKKSQRLFYYYQIFVKRAINFLNNVKNKKINKPIHAIDVDQVCNIIRSTNGYI